MKHRERTHGRASRWLWRQLPSLVLAGLLLGGAGFAIYRERAEVARAWQAQEAARRAQVSAREAALARGDFSEVLVLCRNGWREELHLHHQPVALAWTRHGLDGYFLEGSDRSSLRQVRCDAQGVSRGPRVLHPLHARLPAEAPSGSGPAGERWQLALAQLSAEALDPVDLAVELLEHPLSGALLRRWRAGEGGARASVEPADAPAFPLLVAVPRFQPVQGGAPAPLQPLPRHHWLAQPDAAFGVIERALPADARIAEITLTDDAIELSIEWPTPAFEGKSTEPYGDKDFDEYGAAQMDFWYPREIPGFGCRAGQSLARVRAAFAEARARVVGRPLLRAWYSCSTAYGNGRDGVWHLQVQAQ